jgi:hypothetical protein
LGFEPPPRILGQDPLALRRDPDGQLGIDLGDAFEVDSGAGRLDDGVRRLALQRLAQARRIPRDEDSTRR